MAEGTRGVATIDETTAEAVAAQYFDDWWERYGQHYDTVGSANVGPEDLARAAWRACARRIIPELVKQVQSATSDAIEGA